MLRTFTLIACAVAAFAADDPWAKVKELKSGAEIRIYKRGSPAPVMAKLDEVRDTTLSVVVKNEQLTIEKEQIDRLDYRPPAGNRAVSETKSKTENPDPTPPKGMNHGPAVPGASSSTTVSLGSRPDFQIVYRRVPEKK